MRKKSKSIIPSKQRLKFNGDVKRRKKSTSLIPSKQRLKFNGDVKSISIPANIMFELNILFLIINEQKKILGRQRLNALLSNHRDLARQTIRLNV